MEYYLSKEEAMEKEYREKRKKLEYAIEQLNRGLRKATYELALAGASKSIFKILQAEFRLTCEDDMLLYLEFENKPVEQFDFEFLVWWHNLKVDFKYTDLEGSLLIEIEQLIENFNERYKSFIL